MSAHPGPATPPSPYDAIPDEYDELANLPTSATIPQHELEHAVALEREAIATWLDVRSVEQADLGFQLKAIGERQEANACFGESNQLRCAAQAIRQGEHWRAHG